MTELVKTIQNSSDEEFKPMSMTELIDYYKAHRNYVAPEYVCMVGGYYSEEDLRSLSTEALTIMRMQSIVGRDFTERMMEKVCDSRLVEIYKTGL